MPTGTDPDRANEPNQRAPITYNDIADWSADRLPPQHEGPPLARRFATEMKCDDSYVTEFLDRQVHRTNWGQ